MEYILLALIILVLALIGLAIGFLYMIFMEWYGINDNEVHYCIMGLHKYNRRFTGECQQCLDLKKSREAPKKRSVDSIVRSK